MATIGDCLWKFNLAKVVVIDVTDDYRLMQGPLPSDCYPVLKEMFVPSFTLETILVSSDLVENYLYDWHESPANFDAPWYVGVVHRDLLELKHLGLSR